LFSVKRRFTLMASAAVFAGALAALLLFRGDPPDTGMPQPPASGFAPPSAGLQLLVQSNNIAGTSAAELRALRSFYQRRSYAPAWLTAGKVSDLAHQFAAAFGDAEAKGLKPHDYGASAWLDRFAAVDRGMSGDEAARFDVDLTIAALRYLSDVSIGRANPGVYTRLAHRNGRTILDVLETVRAAPVLAQAVEQEEPQFEEYRGLLRALPRYRALALQEPQPQFAAPRKTVEPGSEFADVPRLARFLGAAGDLPDNAPIPDTSRTYSGVLVDAMKRFQDRHGLPADGRLGRETFEALNIPLAARVRQIELALERWRWIPRDAKPPLIVINVPELELRVLDPARQEQLHMRIIAGEYPGHETPLFSGELQYIIFHPYWNVPLGIQKHELVPHLEKDRDYLAKHDYELLNRQGKKVQTAITDKVLEQLKSGELTIRQAPGSQNALGRVKFVFPNENNVYLHDTPSRSLFARSRRLLSHGCIRVEKPRELAVWLLREDPAWPEDRVARALEGNKTQQVNLRTRVPVIIVYQTATAHQDGRVRFFKDFYHQDKELSDRLESRRASPSL
jgi:murein L,D-transpeptidase YcbB/YkuD